MIQIDMAKALTIAQDRVRAVRGEKFPVLDEAFMRAVEAGSTAVQADISFRKQALRDAPADARLADAPDPDALKGAIDLVVSDIDAHVAAAAVTAVPDISDRQFFEMLAVQQIITKDEALAAVKMGEIPTALLSIVDTIQDEDELFRVKMLLSGATTFQRVHPTTESIRLARGMTPEECDDFFFAASKL